MSTLVKPMLGKAAVLEDIRFPVYVSAKCDGIRGSVQKQKLLSRTLREIPNGFVQERFARPEFEGLDGELILGEPNAPDVCRVSGGACARGAFKPDVRLFVFDLLTCPGSFEQRLARLAERAKSFPAHVILLPQQLVHNMEELLAYEARVLALGFEGLILRNPNALYKQGRSTINEGGMLKIKRFVDAEARVLGVMEQQENRNAAVRGADGRSKRSTSMAGKVGKGCAGSLLVQDVVTGVEFTIGAGPDADWFWANRKEPATRMHEGLPLYDVPADVFVKYKHFPIGAKDKPRQPINLGIRQGFDMPKAETPKLRLVVNNQEAA